MTARGATAIIDQRRAERLAEELGFEERITRLEHETELLWHAVRGLNTAVGGLTALGRDTRIGLGIAAKVQTSHAERLRRLERAERGDPPNLADVVAGSSGRDRSAGRASRAVGANRPQRSAAERRIARHRAAPRRHRVGRGVPAMNRHASPLFPQLRDLTNANAHRHRREQRKRSKQRRRNWTPRVVLTQQDARLAVVAAGSFLAGVIVAMCMSVSIF